MNEDGKFKPVRGFNTSVIAAPPANGISRLG